MTDAQILAAARRQGSYAMNPKPPLISTVPAPANHTLLTAILEDDGTVSHVCRDPIIAYVVTVHPAADEFGMPEYIYTQPVVPLYEGEQFVGGDWWSNDKRQPRAIERGTDGSVVTRDGCATYDNADAWLAALKPWPKQKRGRK